MYTEPDVGWHWAVSALIRPIYDVEEPIILGKEQCARLSPIYISSRRARRRRRACLRQERSTSGSLLRLNCLMPHECFERERGFDDDDDRITRLSNAENELQRKNCAPFLTQPPWGRHAFHGSPRILEKHRRVNRTEVLPVGCRQGRAVDAGFRSACRRPVGSMRFKRGETCPSPVGPVSLEERRLGVVGRPVGRVARRLTWGRGPQVVRYEDFSAAVETAGPCVVVSAAWRRRQRDFDPILDSYGRGLSRIGNLRRYGNCARFSGGSQGGDLERLAAPDLRRRGGRKTVPGTCTTRERCLPRRSARSAMTLKRRAGVGRENNVTPRDFFIL